MSLMDTLRRGTESTAMKVFFVIVVISFVFWGVDANMAGGSMSSTLALVNGERVTDMEYQRRMRDVTGRMRVAPDEDQLKVIGRQVLEGLIEEKVTLHEADRLGIEVSNDELARFILQYDAFKDNDGKFSTKLYERHLK